MDKGFLTAFLMASTGMMTIHAAEWTWTGADDGNYNEAANWGGSTPGAGDAATFYAPGAGNLDVSLVTGAEVGSLLFNEEADSDVTLDFAGQAYHLVNDIVVEPGSSGAHSLVDTLSGAGTGLILGLPADVSGTYAHNLTNDSSQTLTISSNISGTSPNAVSITRDLNIGGEGNIQISGAILNTGTVFSTSSTIINLTKVGTGTLTLSSTTSTYSGVTRISGGVLEATSLSAAGEGIPSSIGASTNLASQLVLSGGTLRYIGAGGTSARNITLGTGISAIESDGTDAIFFTNGLAMAYEGSGDRTLIFGGGNTGTNRWRPAIANGPGGITSVVKSGTGTWTFQTTNTFTGTLSLLGGIYEIDNVGQLGANASALFMNSGTLHLRTFTRSITANTHLTTLGEGGGTVSVDPNIALSFLQAVSGSGSLTKVGSGTLTMGALLKTYTGGTIIKEGTLGAVSDAALGDATGDVIFNGGTLAMTSAAASNITSARNYIIGEGGGIWNKTIAGAGAWSITGTVSGTGALTAMAAGTTIALNSENSFSGPLTVASGTVRLGNVNALQNSTAIVNAENGLTFATASGTHTLGGLSGTGNFAIASTNGSEITLRVGNNGSSNTYSGGLSGIGSFVKTGTGVQTLSGTHTYTGATTIDGGTLLITGELNSTSAITVNDGGKISSGAGVTLSNDITVASGGRIGGNGTYADADGITLVNGAIAAPGNSAGNSIYETDLSFVNGAIYEWELSAYDENPGVTSDLITMNGAGNLLTFEDGSLITLNFLGIDNPNNPGALSFWYFDHIWKIVDATGGGSFVNDGLLIQGGGVYASGFFGFDTDGEDLYLTYATTIPEPSTLLLLGLGGAVIISLRRRKAGSQV